MKTKTVHIEGMSCMHCVNRVEQALNKLPGVEAKVDLTSASATLTSLEDINDETLRNTVETAGYTVTSII